MIGYAELEGGKTKQEQADEAKRLIHLFKVKTVPTGSNENDGIIPVMAISETDRSVVGGLLALIELYNVKYGARTFDEAFVNGGDPHFIGAKTNGGAKALKHIDRERRGTVIKAHQKMTGKQRTKLHSSLETFVRMLHGGRGSGKPSKFSGVADLLGIKGRITSVLVKRAGFGGIVKPNAFRKKEARRAALKGEKQRRLKKMV